MKLSFLFSKPTRLLSTVSVAFGTVLVMGWVASCATTPPPDNKSNAEINSGRSIPDAPGDAGETGPKKDQNDPSSPSKAKAPEKVANSAPTAAAASDMFCNDFVNVRSGPGMKFDVTRKLDRGAKVSALSSENEIWTKIGEKEYVATRFLSKEAPQKLGNAQGDAPAKASSKK